MAKDAKHTARPVDTRRDLVRDWPVVRVAWSMAQVRPSMENSSANSSVWRRLAWNKKDPMPRTKRDADMKSILGASNPALPGPYMYRSARWTGQGRGELLAPGTAWMGISRYTWQLRHTIGEVRQRVDKLGHVERQGVVLFAETACSSAHSNACSGREARASLCSAGWRAPGSPEGMGIAVKPNIVVAHLCRCARGSRSMELSVGVEDVWLMET